MTRDKTSKTALFRRVTSHLSRVTLCILAILTLLCAIPTHAQPPDPAATAQAAADEADVQQQRANWAAAAARSARATESAAWSQATAQAAQITAAAEWAATATPAAATIQAQATADTIHLQATQTAQSIQTTATAQSARATATADHQSAVATATRAAALAELDHLQLQRARALQPLYTLIPWIIAAALAITITILLHRLTHPPTPIEILDPLPNPEPNGRAQQAPYPIPNTQYPPPPIALLPARIETRCHLRPIASSQSQRQQ